jgi:predicted RNase H-like HicB family nuclease
MQQAFTAIAEKCHDTNLFVGYVPNMPGAHSQAKTLDELHHNLREVIEMLLEDGEQAKDIGLTIDELLQNR